METGNYQQKQRGFMKSKLAKTISRAVLTKRSWPAAAGKCSSSSSSKVRPAGPSSSARNSISGSAGSVSYSTVHQDLSNPSSLQKVAALSSSANKQTTYGYNFDYGGDGDENVDMKATDFISYVRGRFKQERPVNSKAF